MQTEKKNPSAPHHTKFTRTAAAHSHPMHGPNFDHFRRHTSEKWLLTNKSIYKSEFCACKWREKANPPTFILRSPDEINKFRRSCRTNDTLSGYMAFNTGAFVVSKLTEELLSARCRHVDLSVWRNRLISNATLHHEGNRKTYPFQWQQHWQWVEARRRWQNELPLNRIFKCISDMTAAKLRGNRCFRRLIVSPFFSLSSLSRSYPLSNYYHPTWPFIAAWSSIVYNS